MKQAASKAMLFSFLPYASHLKMDMTCSSESSIDFQHIIGIISQKTELFITTALRTSDPMR
jgi:hypothetical protein